MNRREAFSKLFGVGAAAVTATTLTTHAAPEMVVHSLGSHFCPKCARAMWTYHPNSDLTKFAAMCTGNDCSMSGKSYAVKPNTILVNDPTLPLPNGWKPRRE